MLFRDGIFKIEPLSGRLWPAPARLLKGWGFRAPFRVPLRFTWRFRGSYKWVTSPPRWVVSIVTLLITPLVTSHEPPSRVWFRV